MTDELRRVGILSPGDMGAGIGSVLRQTGLDVLTSLGGRSNLTRLRAEEAGIQDAGSIDDLVRRVDVILSVLVPSEATAVATRVAEAIRRTGAKPVFVECNAIAPQTVLAIEKVIRDAGGGFIDTGIIGGPPRAPGGGTHFCCSGPDTAAFEALGRHGLEVRVVGPKVGQASALKMVYAASTKGTTAVWTELLVAARALDLEEALRNELGSAFERQAGSITSMPRRARRWVGEMEEIAATFEGIGLTPRILQGAADIYRFVSDTTLADQTSREPDPSLDQVLDTLAERLKE
jgi:3-hydroxyisobutyrate dehydrogenase-like beta-hydroxyacid dehydrogenase